MAILKGNAFEFISLGPAQTRRVGMRLGKLLQSGDLICLQGDLGAGKTTLVQGLTQGWGSNDPVTSPTFIIVNRYTRPDGAYLYHLDTYRLDAAVEAEMLGLDDMLDEGALVIEWPQKIRAALPPQRLWIEILHTDAEDRRLLRFSGTGPRAEALLRALRAAFTGGI